MATQTIGLPMAGDAAFEVLPRRLGMAENPESLIVVERGDHAPAPFYAESEMTLAAECLRAVTGRAVADPTKGLGTMRGQEIHGVEGRCAWTVVTAHTGALRVAGHAVGLAGGSLCSMGRHPVGGMEAEGSRRGRHHPLGATFHRKRNLQYGGRKMGGSSVTGGAGASVVADGAIPGRCRGEGSVGPGEVRPSVGSGCRKLQGS